MAAIDKQTLSVPDAYDVEQYIDDLKKDIDNLDERLDTVLDRLDSLEARLRRGNEEL